LVALSARVKNEEFADEIVKKAALPRKNKLISFSKFNNY
jgi:hypothetical protein